MAHVMTEKEKLEWLEKKLKELENNPERQRMEEAANKRKDARLNELAEIHRRAK